VESAHERRLNKARLYIANTEEIKLRRQAKAFLHIAPFSYGALASFIPGDDAADALKQPGSGCSGIVRLPGCLRAKRSWWC
jgi:NADH-quinone oxidoreductase subunit G